jgi:hypothetical protein
MNRNSVGATVATLAVVVVLALGFRFLGSPARQRLLRSDQQDIWALSMLAGQLNSSWTGPLHALPETTDGINLGTARRTSVSGKPFVYHRKDASHYELCATFGTDDREQHLANLPDFWLHPKGDYCFQFDAAQPVPSVPYGPYISY